jgi:DNA replication protein DnaC
MSVVEICNICGGSGWKITERDGISGAEKCECQNVGRELRMEERANIPPLYQKASLDNFILPSDNSIARTGLAQVLVMVKAYVRKFPDLPKPGLLFIGLPGTGKTHLAVAALRGLIEKGHEGVFFDFQTLLTQIHSAYDQASGRSDRDAYRKALDTEILLLDDMGSHRVNEWVEDTLTSIVTHRCNERMTTIITTNLRDPQAGDSRTPNRSSPEDNRAQPGGVDTQSKWVDEAIHSKYFLEERVGMRVRSRLFEMCTLIKMPDVEDYRLKRR